MSNELTKSRNFNMEFKPAVLEINNYDEMKSLVEDYSNRYKGLVFTREDKSGATKARSELLELRKAFETEEKSVTAVYNEPLQNFKGKMKQMYSLIDEPLNDIRDGLKELDNQERAEREEALKDYLSKKLAIEGLSVDDLEKSGRWLNKGMWTDDLEPRKELIQGINTAIKDAVKKKEFREMQVKVLTEFCKSQDIDPAGWVSQLEHRNAMEVIDLINLEKQRKEKLAKEQENKRKEYEEFMAKQQQAKEEADLLVDDVPEVGEDITLYTDTIRVTGTKKQLKALNNFLVSNGIHVEGVPQVNTDELPFG